MLFIEQTTQNYSSCANSITLKTFWNVMDGTGMKLNWLQESIRKGRHYFYDSKKYCIHHQNAV